MFRLLARVYKDQETALSGKYKDSYVLPTETGKNYFKNCSEVQFLASY
jgi:hypothetical protein